MARRRRGRSLSGWIVVDKPVGPTSASIVNKLRWLFDAQKAGHAGTLDPAATGVLAIAFGEATKTIPYVTDALKCYRFVVRLGQTTATDDADGEIVSTSEMRPDTDRICAILPDFVGEILQVPPRYSAVKVEGMRAYALARDGQEPALAPRPLYVDELRLIGRLDADHVELEMICGKGGYVRSIARDIGARLGCGAHVLTLRRVWSGPFDVSQAAPTSLLDTELRDPTLDRFLLPLETALRGLPELPCSAESAARLRNGNPAPVVASNADFGDLAWASHLGKAVAIGTYRAGSLHPSRVLNT